VINNAVERKREREREREGEREGERGRGREIRQHSAKNFL